MSDEAKIIRATFFQLESGRQPVRDWLRGELTEEQRTEIGSDLRTVEYHWPVGMPTVRKIEPDLWEVRTSFKEGIARVFFTVKDARMILLHGYIKKTQKAPQEDLDLARKRLAIAKGRD